SQRLGFTGEMVGEMETGIATHPLERDEGGERALRLLRLLRADRAVLLHAAEHIGEPLLRARGMAVGIEIARPLRQRGKERALAQAERGRAFAEIAARGHLDAPGAAAEEDRIEIELENFRLAERALDARGEHHFAH